MTAAFAADKKSATLTSSTNLVAGSYTVKVAGAAEGKDSATVTVAAEKVAKIEFTSNVIVKTGADTGTIGYKVYNQYNQDITKNALANSLTWAGVGFDSLTDNNEGVLTVDKASAFTDTDSLTISVIDATSGTTAKGTFTPAASAALKELSFGTMTLPTGKTRVEANVANAAEVAVVAKDQYGNDITTAAALAAATTIVDNDANATASFVDVDGKPYLRLNTTGMAAAKTVSVTVLINASGTPVTYSFDVVTAPAAAEIAVTAPTGIIATGDATSSVVAALAVKDQFGSVMTADQVATAALAGDFTITSSNSTVFQSGDLTIATAGENKGKLVNSGSVVRGAGQTTITVTVNSTGKSASFVLEAKAARAASTIVVPAGVTTNLLSGATTSFNYNFVDQYGKTFTDLTTNAGDLKVNLSVTKVSGDDNGLTVSPAGDTTDESTLDAANAVTLTAASGKTGVYTVVAKLVKISTGETVSQASTNVTVAANNTTGLTYSIESIPTLAGDQDYAQDGSSAYAAPITVVAKDAAGNTYAIPASQILSVASSNTAVAEVSGAQLGDVAINKQDNQWVVAGNDISAGTTATQTATITVQLNTQDGIKFLTKEVTVAKAAPATQSIRVVDTALAAGNPYAIPTTATDVTKVTFANRAAAEAGTAAFAIGLDQYGVYTNLVKDGTSVVLNTVGKATANVDGNNGFEFDGAEFILDEAANAQETANIRYLAGTDLRYSIVDGTATASIVVNVTAEEAPGVASDNTGTDGNANAGKMAAGETSIITFNEELSAASKTAIETAAKTAYDAVKGAAGWTTVADGTHGSAVWTVAAGKSVLTITASGDVVANTVNIPTFTLNMTDIIDVIGNKAGTTGTVSITPAS